VNCHASACSVGVHGMRPLGPRGGWRWQTGSNALPGACHAPLQNRSAYGRIPTSPAQRGRGVGSEGCRWTRARVFLEQADATGLIDGLGAVRRLQLAEDIAEMFFHRLFADKEVLTNITIRESG
jgi:hypothetical protein